MEVVMRSALLVVLSLTLGLAVAVPVAQTRGPAEDQAKPRAQSGNRQGDNPPASPGRAQPRSQPPATAEPPAREPAPQGRAQPRPPDQSSRGRAQPHRQAPPPRVVPPRYYARPHVYAFPPISLQRGFYYHPYFGFYYGPYYGPFYPFPGPAFGPPLFSASAVRTRVKPVDTEVYVNGYYAGLVDDFDGLFQRLYVPAGQHEITFRLAGYETHRERVYVSPGDTRDITFTMQPLKPGETSAMPAPSRALPDEWATAPPLASGDQPASPFGVLTLRLDPPDAQLWVDGDAWPDVSGRSEIVLHVAAGPHHLEVRRSGYRTFSTDIELSEGASTKLTVALER
jgi:PEGA domain